VHASSDQLVLLSLNGIRCRAQGQQALVGETECHPANAVGEPCAGEPHARIDGEGLEMDASDHGMATLKPARETRWPVRCLRTGDTTAYRAAPYPTILAVGTSVVS
jgi:hypothetical protein